MRYIGGKTQLLNDIDAVINKNALGNECIFCDIFSGTGSVARYFKPRYEIHSNDMLHFSYVIQKATVENNHKPNFEQLRNIGIYDPIKFLEETRFDTTKLDRDSLFITHNYSPNDNCKRMYVSNKNAQRIDFIRTTIENWKLNNLIGELEYYYLLASLIEGVPYISNITGTYGAYLKQWDKRALKEFEMARLDVVDNKQKNKSYNTDANKLIRELEGDILYLDPPYNSRQYASNYHLLETISKYDHPQIKGITGIRTYDNEKSAFCNKNEVLDVFEDLINKAKFSNIILSYSTQGLMSSEQIEKVFKKHGIESSYRRYDIPYRKYKSKIVKDDNKIEEYLFYIKKDIVRPLYDCSKGNNHTNNNDTSSITNTNTFLTITNTFPSIIYNNTAQLPFIGQPAIIQSALGQSVITQPTLSTENRKRKYLKSPLNYIGGKYKLLPQILPLLPNNISTFVDLFAGGCNVGINVVADKVICNDINSKIIEMYKIFQETDVQKILSQIEQNIERFGLSKHNEQGFIQFRDYYNQTKNPIDLYTLSCYSFNYQFRFNNNLEYNNPFGRNRSHFSDTMKYNLIMFIEHIKKQNIVFTNYDFTELKLDKLTYEDMVYCDPPYLITTGSYNDGNRGFKDWKEKQEFVNECAVLFRKIGINIFDVIETAATKWNFCNVHPGLVGGHCIGIDPYYLINLSEKNSHTLQLVERSRHINEWMSVYIAEQLVKLLNLLNSDDKKKVLIYGITYKENVSDIRNTKVVDLVHELSKYGISVYITDYLACPNEVESEYNITLYNDTHLYDLDALIFAVKHMEYRSYHLCELKKKYKGTNMILLDLYRIFDEREAIDHGFVYWSL